MELVGIFVQIIFCQVYKTNWIYKTLDLHKNSFLIFNKAEITSLLPGNNNTVTLSENVSAHIYVRLNMRVEKC